MKDIVLSPIPLPELLKEFASLVNTNEAPVTSDYDHPNVNDECVDIAALAKFLNVTQQTIIKFKSKGVIPYLQIGRSVRFNKREVVDALRKKRKQ